jgi:DNA-directed RNA polymerase subunit RPC12/RpoP
MNSLDQLALATLGRTDEIDRTRYPTLAGLDLARTDLRYSPNGPDFFQRAGLSAQPRYYDEALKLGFDTRRFYEQDPLVPFVVCPYCFSLRTPDPICWACGEDTRLDAAVETSAAELTAMKQKPCGQCGTMVPDLAIRCPKCRSKVE